MNKKFWVLVEMLFVKKGVKNKARIFGFVNFG
jgi:hypothetical protein